MNGPTEPRQGRHATPESGTDAARSAAELLAAWSGAAAGGGATAVGVAEPRTAAPLGTPCDDDDDARPRRGRYAPESDGDLPTPMTARRPADDVPWPSVPARPRASTGADPSGAAPAPRAGRPSTRAVASAPRTAAMPAIAPRVPAARPQPGEPVTGPLVRAGFAGAEARTEPGVSSGASRPRLDGGLPLEFRHHVPADDEPDDEYDDEHHDGTQSRVFDQTGGLEVIVADDHEPHDDPFGDDHFGDDPFGDDGDGPGGGRGRRGGSGGSGGGRGGRAGKRRRPLAVVISLMVLAALVVGIILGGQSLLRAINPVAEDYTGAGTGSVDIRINEGDSLRTIAGTLVDAGVIASTEPFVDAAKDHPAATSIQPGVYRMQDQMSGSSALDLLLDPATRQVSRVTVPEGMTVAQVLQRLSDTTGTPLADLQAATTDTAALGLPPYANGLLEGFLFPATYEVEPGTAPVDILKPMVARTVQALDALQVPVDQRLTVLTKASIVQAESGSVEDMGKVAQVLENRLADGMPLQLDTTVNYANGKKGVTTTAEDRANPSPYNTYVNVGLPPGAISNPGEQALEAVLAPTPGEWRFFVVVDPDTGDTRFAVTAEEHQQNVLLFQQWLRDHPNG